MLYLCDSEEVTLTRLEVAENNIYNCRRGGKHAVEFRHDFLKRETT